MTRRRKCCPSDSRSSARPSLTRLRLTRTDQHSRYRHQLHPSLAQPDPNCHLWYQSVARTLTNNKPKRASNSDSAAATTPDGLCDVSRVSPCRRTIIPYRLHPSGGLPASENLVVPPILGATLHHTYPICRSATSLRCPDGRATRRKCVRRKRPPTGRDRWA